MKDPNCEFCQGEFDKDVVKNYSHWQVQLFEDQYYLGRSLVKLKRHVEDLSDLRQEERNEFFEKVLPELEQALDNLFSPDLYNQATLGNDCKHFHFHIVPRYSSPRTFEGEEFVDEAWRNHYALKSGKDISQEVFSNIESRLEDELV